MSCIFIFPTWFMCFSVCIYIVWRCNLCHCFTYDVDVLQQFCFSSQGWKCSTKVGWKILSKITWESFPLSFLLDVYRCIREYILRCFLCAKFSRLYCFLERVFNGLISTGMIMVNAWILWKRLNIFLFLLKLWNFFNTT